MQADGAPALGCDAGIVCDHHDGLAGLVERGEQCQDLGAGAAVECAGRFVREDDQRGRNQRAWDEGPSVEPGLPVAISAGQGAVVVAVRADVALRRARRRMVGAAERGIRARCARIVHRARLHPFMRWRGLLPLHGNCRTDRRFALTRRPCPRHALLRSGARVSFCVACEMLLFLCRSQRSQWGAFRTCSAGTINSHQLLMRR